MIDESRRLRSLVFSGLIVPLLFLAFCVLAWSLRALMLPMIIGILLAYLCRPFRSMFRYRWLPNGLRLTFLFSIFLGFLFGGILFVKNNIPNEKEKLELFVRMKYKLNEKFDKMMGLNSATGRGNFFYESMSEDLIPMRAQLNNFLSLSQEQMTAFENYYHSPHEGEKISEKYYQYYLATKKLKNSEQGHPLVLENNKSENSNGGLGVPNHPGTVGNSHEPSTLKILISLLSTWVLLPITFLFFFLDDGAISQFFIRLVPNRYFELSLTVLEAVDGAIGKYLRGLSMECGLVGVSLAFGLFMIGAAAKVAISIGLLAAFATAIPLVGPVMGLGLSLAYAVIAEEIHPLIPLVNLDNLTFAVLIVVAIVFTLDNLVFQPIVLGSAVNLHPLVVILGIMGGSMLFGLAGVLLAVPAIVIVKTILQYTFRGLKDYRII